MISKARIKQIHGLERKKMREREGLFVAEGPKLVGELMAVMQPTYVAATETWIGGNEGKLANVVTERVTDDELRRASLMQHPQEVIALFRIPNLCADLAAEARKGLVLAIDGVQDPGNLGTIVRLADWYGIRHIFCSVDTADIFNPKATQATMGALARVGVHYVSLGRELALADSPVYGTFLDGENIYDQQLTSTGVIVMGNEGQGISPSVSHLVSHRLFIPPFPPGRTTVESLNVAVATAVVCAEFRRRQN